MPKVNFSVDSLPDLSGKTYVVTGGNAGMFVNSLPFQLTAVAN
jgi:hypothetical protein